MQRIFFLKLDVYVLIQKRNSLKNNTSVLAQSGLVVVFIHHKLARPALSLARIN